MPPEISVHELVRMRAANAAFVLLDVREDFELEIASLAFAKHVPLGSLAERRSEIPEEADVVVMCHSGVRSDHAARFLRGSGYASVANLAGGIDAWSREVDPSVPIY